MLELKNSSNKFIIPRGDGFDIDFARYEMDDYFAQVRELMSLRRYTVGKTDVAYRVINHWDQLGLLPTGVKGDGGWRKFTLPEIVWLKAIGRMREFGLPLEKIARAKVEAMEWNEKIERYPYFEYYLVRAWLGESDSYVLITQDGDGEIASMTGIEAAKMCFGSFDVLLISLKKILQDMGFETSRARGMLYVSDKEMEMLSSLRYDKSDEVKAKLNKQGEITEIESTVTKVGSTAPHEIKKMIEEEGLYGDVTLKCENGVPQATKTVKRKRLKG